MADWWGAALIERGPDDLLWARGRLPVTRGRLRSEVARLEALFGRLGIRPGNTVALCGVPSFTQLWALFALWARGAQVMLFDPRSRGRRLREQLGSHRPQYRMTCGDYEHVRTPFSDGCELVFHRRLPGGLPARTDDVLVHVPLNSAGPSDAAVCNPPSLLGELAALRSTPRMTAAGDRVLLLESPVSSFGLVGGVLFGMDRCAVTVFATDHRPEPLARSAAGASVILGSPAHFAALASVTRQSAVPDLRLAISSGPVPGPVQDRFAERYGVRITRR